MTQVFIYRVTNDLLPEMLPRLAPHLAKGLGAIKFDPVNLASAIEADLAQVWAIFDRSEVVGAFMTSILTQDDGSRDLDVYGLGGDRIMAWGKALSDRMADFAKHHDCRRVVFAGRKALARAYGNTVRVIDQKDETTFIYERAV